MTMGFEEVIENQDERDLTLEMRDMYIGQVFSQAINHLGASLDLDAEGERLYEDQFVDFAWQVVVNFVRLGEYSAVREAMMDGVKESSPEMKEKFAEYLNACK